MKKKKGFTLVEMVVVIALLAVFGAIVLSISVSSGKLFAMTQKRSEMNDNARIVSGKIEDDLRVSRKIVGSSDTSAVELDYDGKTYGLPIVSKLVVAYTKKEGVNNVSYALVQTQLPNNERIKLYRLLDDSTIEDTNYELINVESFKVTKDSTSKGYILNIKFNDGKNSAEYNSVITPRN
ncbi:MAG: prepilin-type N-terminal cleavage/methylation domain-containing protein [Clostridium sp.]|uniref:PilW family protein n=1 Tax=Clostridium sp. TaxID=1506 RepID=UPI00290AF986|nr:prepilin-type N-terminal cleavage/methylation domain-containing protein [Clostridium sp.]MDU4938879.1 prepilin-type N-terminal cleavage/methylation domain-containing protein [Clostridium sp.]